MQDGKKTRKTKTAHIVDKITHDQYFVEVNPEIMNCTKQESTTLVIARFRMLECGTNYKGTMRETCQTCNLTDDENHRLNFCTKYTATNRSSQIDKVDFNDVYSTDIQVLKKVIQEIEKVWNTKSAHGTMFK